jgi:hypothetical protein
MRPLALSWDADTEFPIALDLIKSQLRVGHDEFDVLIHLLHLPAAVEWAEGEMHRSILAKEHQWVLSDFPRRDLGIRLPRGKTQSVSSIVYAASATSTVTLRGPTSGSPIGSDYREELRGDSGGTIYPLTDWPAVDLAAPAPVVITFTAGWDAVRVPGDIKMALAMYVADALEITGASDLSAHTDLAVKNSLLSAWRLHRWY